MSNFDNICRLNNYNHTNQNIKPKKYDSNILSSNNINFILAPNEHQPLKEKNIINNDQINPTDKIITLATCDDIGTSRIVVHAKLYSIEEK